MDKFIVEGGVPLRGEISVHGAKNSALHLLAATILADGPCTITNVPQVWDVGTLCRILQGLGMEVNRSGDAVRVETRDDSQYVAPYDLVRRMRASFCALGPLLARRQRAKVSLPGGCLLGDRPVDLHLKGLRALGARIEVEHGYVFAEAPKLKGANLYLGGPHGPTAGGTYNLMMAATLAEGTTVIEAASCEPEVEDLAGFLRAMGAKIRGDGSHRIVVEGVPKLHGAEYRAMPDRMEAATYLIAGAITGGDVTVRNARTDHLAAVLDKMEEIGFAFEATDSTCRVTENSRLRAVDLTTQPYPGFPTDMQAPLTALLTQADGISIVTERIFPDRFMHIAELNRMGARVRKEGASALIEGVPRLSGAPVMASDIRAGAALLLAGLSATGCTELHRVYHMDRGYEAFEEGMNHLSARIRRVAD